MTVERNMAAAQLNLDYINDYGNGTELAEVVEMVRNFHSAIAEIANAIADRLEMSNG